MYVTVKVVAVSSTHPAYKVIDAVILSDSNTHDCVQASSLYQPLKIYPLYFGSAGSVNKSPSFTVLLSTDEPPIELKVTVNSRIIASSSFHLA